MVTRGEIAALVKLLEDPDPEIHGAVVERLQQFDETAVPLLDEFQVGERNQEVKKELERTIHALTIRSLEQEFLNYLECGVYTLEDLEDGIFLLSRFGNPTLRTDLYRRNLDKMAGELREPLLLLEDPLEQMFLVLTYLFKEQQFKGNDTEYFDPANSYLNQVMDHKRGLPISLSLLVLFLGRRLDLPFQGVNMPLHFMLRFDSRGQTHLIDAFRGGFIVTADQCHQFLLQNGIAPQPVHFEPAGALEILSRCVRNLINGYEKLGEEGRAGHLKRWHGYIEAFSEGHPG